MIDKELVLRIPHSLGTYEAKRRVAASINPVKARYGKFLRSVETHWDANRLNFSLSALSQTVQGSVDVADEFVELRAHLPVLVRVFAKHVTRIIQDIAPKFLK